MSHRKLLQQKITQEDITDILLKQSISKDDMKKLNSFKEDLKDKKKSKEQELKDLDRELPENSKKIKSITDSIQNKNNQIEKIMAKIESCKNANIKQNTDTKSNKNSDSKQNTDTKSKQNTDTKSKQNTDIKSKQNTLKQTDSRKDVVNQKPNIERETIKYDPALDQIKKRLDDLCFTRNSFTGDKKLVTTGKGESWAVFFMNRDINALVKEYEEKFGLRIVGSDVVEGEEDMFLLHRSKDNKKFAMYVELKGNKVVPFNDIWEASALLEDLLKS